MLDDLPPPIGPEIEKIIARLYPPVVQDLIETSESLMHKKIARLQVVMMGLVRARLFEEKDHIQYKKSVYALMSRIVVEELRHWLVGLKDSEQQWIEWQKELHRQRMRNILAWWDSRNRGSPESE